MNFWTKFKKVTKIRFSIGMIIVGLFFVILSAFAIVNRKEVATLETEGIISNIIETEDYDTDGDLVRKYEVYVTYTDFNSNVHENILYPSYHTGMKIGDTITIVYDASDPENIDPNGGKVLIYVILAIGALVLIIGTYQLVKTIKTPSEKMNEFNRVDESKVNEIQKEEVLNNTEEKKEYYFHYFGKLNQSYVLETPDREAVYEAICDKFNFFGKDTFTFKNKLNGNSKTMKVSKAVSHSTGDGRGFEVILDSSFKFDDVNNWDYIGNLGYSTDFHLDGLKVSGEISHYSIKVADFVPGGTNVVKGTDSKLGNLPARGIYIVHCKESDIEAVFFILFSLARIN